MEAHSELQFSGDTQRCPLHSDETLFNASLSPRPSSGTAQLGTVPKVRNHTPPGDVTGAAGEPLFLGQFLDPHPQPHPAARVWMRGTGGGAAPSWDSARDQGFFGRT